MRYGLGRKPVQKQVDRHRSGQTCRGHPSDSDQIRIAYIVAASCPESGLLSPRSVAFGVLAKGFGFPFSFTLALGGCGGGS